MKEWTKKQIKNWSMKKKILRLLLRIRSSLKKKSRRESELYYCVTEQEVLGKFEAVFAGNLNIYKII